jgi:hypothetical protein
MGRIHAVLVTVLVAATTVAAAQEVGDRQALARQIEQRFDVLPVQAGVVLTPRGADRGVRSIELAAGAIAIDGVPVTGGELKQRLGADADLIIRLSYLEAADQRALFGAAAQPAAQTPAPATPPVPSTPPTPPTPQTPDAPQAPGPGSRRDGDRNNDRVRIGGSVQVGPGDTINGDVVAIGGSADVNGEVSGDVVAIGGSVNLGPMADVEGDVVAVGGTLNRSPGARVGGEVHEVGFGEFDFGSGGWLHPGMGGAMFGSAVGSLFALVSTLARLAVLCILASMVLLFARGYVERVSVRAASEPVKAGAVGFLIQLLFFPALCAMILVMVITIIGIPLLLLVPFALLAFALLFLVGFTAVVYDVGRLAAARFGWDMQNPYLVAALGIALVLLPVLMSRLVGFGGALISPVTWTLIILGLLIEYVVWTVGLGAVALVRFDRKLDSGTVGPVTDGSVLAPS